MKKTALFLLLFMGLTSATFAFSAENIKFDKLPKFKLDKTQLKVMTKANLSIYEIKDGYAYPAKGHVFYATKTDKGGLFIIVLNSNSKTDPDFIVLNPRTLPFQVTEIGDVMEYCSCGSNIMPTEGDNCQQYAVSATETVTSVQCGGGCEGDNEGRTCSYTRFDTLTGKFIVD